MARRLLLAALALVALTPAFAGQDWLPPPKPPASLVEAPIPAQAVDLIVSYEIGSPQTYQRKYRHPIWPGAMSGVTVGIGYDLGHSRPDVIVMDWERHPHRARLANASGIVGELAAPQARELADIVVEYDYAREVFDQTSVIVHFRIARRVFREGFDVAPPNVQGALTSLVFNRGGSMVGENRREMRVIRDVCLPAGDRFCVATQLRLMKRLWAGRGLRGLIDRREAEAQLALTP